MSKPKNRRIAITLSPEATRILDALMAESLQTTPSPVFLKLLADEYRRRLKVKNTKNHGKKS